MQKDMMQVLKYVLIIHHVNYFMFIPFIIINIRNIIVLEFMHNSL